MSPVNSARATAARVQRNIPTSLTIRFTNARDMKAVESLFHGTSKEKLDPKRKVRARSKEELEAPISGGSAIIATDQDGLIRFFAMASDHFKYTHNAMAVTEIGGIMSDVGGFKLTQVASAMLALSETMRLREEYPCLRSHGLHALVANDNPAAQKVFGRDSQWDGVACDQKRGTLFDTQGKYSQDNDRAARIWYGFQDAALHAARERTMKTIHAGALTSKSGESIAVNLDARVHTLV
ncbi:MAG: hypothetical protein ACRBCT_04515 [Alphaproteobacteria bacterium]